MFCEEKIISSGASSAADWQQKITQIAQTSLLLHLL